LLIQIINLGLGNIISIENWLNAIGKNYSIINEDIKVHDETDITFVLPGVANSIDYLHNLKSFTNLYDQIKNKRFNKIIGICAGFQVLCRQVEENGEEAQGLSIIPAVSSDRLQPIYNNGWGATRILNDIPNSISVRKNVYFNHSCGVFPKNNFQAFDLNKKGFANSYLTKNIVGLQFHPEKSGSFGIELGKYIFDV
jgi:imidazole glycerol-phosphate synthase subunit HisH